MALSDREKITRAKQRMEFICGLYAHCAVFVVVNAILFVVNLAGDAGWWVQWVVLGWGAGLVLHWFLVFGQMPAAIRRWQVRQIKKIKDEM